jgi:hypothetical protein
MNSSSLVLSVMTLISFCFCLRTFEDTQTFHKHLWHSLSLFQQEKLELLSFIYNDEPSLCFYHVVSFLLCPIRISFHFTSSSSAHGNEPNCLGPANLTEGGGIHNLLSWCFQNICMMKTRRGTFSWIALSFEEAKHVFTPWTRT